MSIARMTGGDWLIVRALLVMTWSWATPYPWQVDAFAMFPLLVMGAVYNTFTGEFK